LTVKNDTKARRKIEAPYADAKKIDRTNHRSTLVGTMYYVQCTMYIHDVFKKHNLIAYSFLY
jgi:hypothetical protein